MLAVVLKIIKNRIQGADNVTDAALRVAIAYGIAVVYGIEHEC